MIDGLHSRTAGTLFISPVAQVVAIELAHLQYSYTKEESGICTIVNHAFFSPQASPPGKPLNIYTTLNTFTN